MSKEEKQELSPSDAIEMAMSQVRARGLSDKHMSALFEGDSQISTREALLIAHIQHLEAKAFALASIMDEIAAMGGDAGVVAQAALEQIAVPRNTSEGK